MGGASRQLWGIGKVCSTSNEAEWVAGSIPAPPLRLRGTVIRSKKGEKKRKMAMTGTLDKVLGKLFDLYVENRIEDDPTKRYLLLLRNPDEEKTFSEEDADRILDMLREAKYEGDNYVGGEKSEDDMVECIKNARTREDLDAMEEAVLSLRKSYRETHAVEDVLVQTKWLDAIEKRRKKGKW